MVTTVNCSHVDDIERYKILAIDPGTRVMGWCLGRENYEASGEYRFESARIWDKVWSLHRWIDKFLALHEPDVVGLEWPIGTGGNAAKIKLGMAIGVIGSMASKFSIPVFEIGSSSVKTTGCHKGALAYAGGLARKPVGPDEADAIGVYLALSARLYGVSLEQAVKQWDRDWSTR